MGEADVLLAEDLEALELGRALLAEDARRRRLEEAEEEAEMKTEEDEEGSGGVKVKEEAHDEDVQDPRETGSADAAQQQEGMCSLSSRNLNVH